MNFFFFLQKPGTLPIAIPIVLFRERDTPGSLCLIWGCHKYMQYMTHTCNWILRKLHPGRVKQNRTISYMYFVVLFHIYK